MSKKSFNVRDTKTGKVLGCVKNFDPNKIADNLKSKGVAVACFGLMMTSILSMVGETVSDIRELSELNPVASHTIEYLAEDIADRAEIIYNASDVKSIKDDVDSKIEYIDMIIEEYQSEGYQGEEHFIEEVNKYYEIKAEYFKEDYIEYSQLADIREVIGNICESFTEMSKKHKIPQPNNPPIEEFVDEKRRKGMKV